jgi:hypothetical protein
MHVTCWHVVSTLAAFKLMVSKPENRKDVA